MLKTLGPFVGEFKVLDNSDEYPSGAIEGYASVFGNEDLGADVVVKGAFKKTLKENLPTGRVKFVDAHELHNGTRSIIGLVKTAKEDDHGLFFTSKLSSVQAAQDIRTKVKEGILDALSFGYSVVKSEPGPNDVRMLKELKLYEISVVPWGMNPKAAITGAKGVVSVSDLGTAPIDHLWDAGEAQKRVLAKIGGDPADWSDSDWKQYAKAFLWADNANYDKLGSYHLPVVDVVDGSMVYVWNGVRSALAAVRGARSGGTNAWSGDAGSIETQLKKLYDRFNKAFPEKGSGEEGDADFKAILSQMNDVVAAISIHNFSKSLRRKS